MLIDVFYLFEATDELQRLFSATDSADLMASRVWSDIKSGRRGLRYPKSEVESAFWAAFLFDVAALEDAGTRLADQCRSIGFARCWRVIESEGGASVEHLIEHAIRSKGLADQALADQAHE